MTVVVEGRDSVFLSDRAVLLDTDHETAAWAEDYVQANPAYSWVLGKFVEAERENANRHWWSVADLSMARPTITNAPMNMLHRPREVVGTFVESKMLYATDGAEDKDGKLVRSAAAASQGEDLEDPHPYIEALGLIWKYYFPVEHAMVKEAHQEGSLAFSMECVSESMTCAGDNGCGKTFDYKGPNDPSYCAHLNQSESRKQMNKPHFVGGALIVPPAKPAWRGAKISDLASFTEGNKAEAEAVYAGIAEEFDHLSVEQWESMMALILAQSKDSARDFSTEEREKLAKKGQAMPDGSYPIATVGDLRNAIQAFGRAKNASAVKQHIIKRAKALGKTDLLPDGWS
jgi:hypothetical protein